MSVTLVNDVRELKVKINAPRGNGTTGTTESYFLPIATSIGTATTQARKLIDLRRRFLFTEATVVDAKLSKWSAPNKTAKVITSPLAGMWPPTARDELSETTISVAPASPAPDLSVDNENLVFQTDELFDYSDPETTALFRLEGDGEIHASRSFHFIPELFVSALKRVNGTAEPVWVDPAAEPDEPTVEVSSADFFTNMKEFFTYLKLYFCMITEVNGAQWNSHTITKVFFEKLNSRDMGPGFGQRRGRARVGS